MTRRALILFLSFLLFFGASPIINALPIKILFIIIFISGIIFILKPIFKKNFIVFSLIYLFSIFLTCIFNQTIIPLYFGLSYLFVLYLAFELISLDPNYFVNKLNIIIKILLIFAVLAFIYFNIGGPPLFSLTNADNRVAYFYLSSFNNGNETIRPTGIYDEPGAFSFFICLLVIYRDILNKSKDSSLMILILGFVTQSLTHIIFFCIYLFNYLSLLKNFNFKSLIKFIFVLSFILISSFVILRSNYSEYTQNRTEKYINDPNSTGRILSMTLIFEELLQDHRKIIFGLDKKAAERDLKYEEDNDFGENVLTPIVYGGLLASWPYYLFLLYLIYHFIFINRNISLIGCLILLVQRPYFLELPYSFPMAFLCLLLLSSAGSRNITTVLNYKA